MLHYFIRLPGALRLGDWSGSDLIACSGLVSPAHRIKIVSGSSTTRFVYHGDALITELIGSNVMQRRYDHANDIDNLIMWYEGSGIGASPRHGLLTAFPDDEPESTSSGNAGVTCSSI